MKKNIALFLLLIMSFTLSGCHKSPKDYLKEIENSENIKYLSTGEIVFSYINISGFDSAGVLYYVLNFENNNVDFLDQFTENKEGEVVEKGRNASFENRVTDLIDSHFKEEYESFEQTNRINWEDEYVYINDKPDYVTFPMIFFVGTSSLILIKLKQ